MREAALSEAQLLIDRLNEFEPEDEDSPREYYGHVFPSFSRLRDLLAALQLPEAEVQSGWTGELPETVPERVDLPPITERGLAGQIMDAAWPHFGGEQIGAEFWYAFSAAVEFSIRSIGPSEANSPAAPVSDDRCDYCGEHGLHHPNLCEDCRHRGKPAPTDAGVREKMADQATLIVYNCVGKIEHQWQRQLIEKINRALSSQPVVEGGSKRDATQKDRSMKNDKPRPKSTIAKHTPQSEGWILVAKDDDSDEWHIAWIDLFPTRNIALGFAVRNGWSQPFRAVRGRLSAIEPI